ncbi:hypothetical protein AMECASPLE_020377 [Ameca splendens]|uniref:Uncharacterized protein n=1 Tax=Ameca splendens TaxID=208324 RepID=A0ABV0Y3A0_9TELE
MLITTCQPPQCRYKKRSDASPTPQQPGIRPGPEPQEEGYHSSPKTRHPPAPQLNPRAAPACRPHTVPHAILLPRPTPNPSPDPDQKACSFFQPSTPDSNQRTALNFQ